MADALALIRPTKGRGIVVIVGWISDSASTLYGAWKRDCCCEGCVSYFLFIDESGQDQKNSPYEVLAGVAVKDTELWNLIQRIHDLEREIFGMRISEGSLELKGKKLLKRKTFRLAGQRPRIDPDKRTEMVRRCLLKGMAHNRHEGEKVKQEELAALGQAKIAFVSFLLELCSQHRVHVFASIVNNSSERPTGEDFLRKDYAFLFERFYYYLEDRSNEPMGAVVFDELEKSRCHLLVNQMETYFLKTAKGRMRSSRIIPEPFFVHSDLTTAVQIADLVAYITSWGVQVGSMQAPTRPELGSLADQVCQLRYRAVRQVNEQENFVVWSFAIIDDLRSKAEE